MHVVTNKSKKQKTEVNEIQKILRNLGLKSTNLGLLNNNGVLLSLLHRSQNNLRRFDIIAARRTSVQNKHLLLRLLLQQLNLLSVGWDAELLLWRNYDLSLRRLEKDLRCVNGLRILLKNDLLGLRKH